MIRLTFAAYLLVLLIFSCSCARKEPAAFRFVTTVAGEPWAETDLPVMGEVHAGIPVMEVNLEAKQQVVDGFGACLNELGWDALNLLPLEERESVLKELFTAEGFNFTICRIPIGANDYSRDWYSLNEHPGDFEMESFSIDRDRQSILPYVLAAMKYYPALLVWASPWCPPAWMKSNNHYACRPAEVNNLPPGGAGREGETQFIMKPEYLSAYALYFSKFIEAYRAEGVNLYAVHVQNEPNSCQNFPSCTWTAADQAEFIGNYLGPLLQEKNPDTEIWYGTYERPWVEKVDTILQHSGASKYISGVGFQWAGKKAIGGVHEKYPQMRLMQTESECGDGSNDQAAAEYTWSLIKHYFENGVNSYLYWNIILDETGKSRWGWKQNSLMTLDRNTNTLTRNPEFWLFRHISHFVKPGAVKLATPMDHKDLLLFLNPDNSLVGILVNPEDENKAIQLKIGERVIVLQMKSRSFTSFSVPL